MLTATEKKRSLNAEFLGFIGTSKYYRYSVLFPYALTDGTKYIAEKLGLYWFYDTVLSYQTRPSALLMGLQRWQLRRVENPKKNSQFLWEVVLLDDAGEALITQGFADICLNGGWEDKFDTYTIYVADGVVFLPSEN